MFLYRGIFTIEVFFYTIVDETCSTPDVVLVAIVPFIYRPTRNIFLIPDDTVDRRKLGF